MKDGEIDDIELAGLREAERAARERAGISGETQPKRFEPVVPTIPAAILEAAERRATQEKAREAEANRQRAERAILAAQGCIPAAFAGLRLGDEALAKRVKRAAAITEAQAAQNDPGIVFHGPAGSGKSTLASALLVAVVAQDFGQRTCAWVPARKLAHARRGHPLGEGEPALVRTATDVDLLILDDLGGEDAAYASAVADVICDRYDAARVTWVTTGFEAKEITARYGAMVSRRVFQRSTAIRCGGQAPS